MFKVFLDRIKMRKILRHYWKHTFIWIEIWKKYLYVRLELETGKIDTQTKRGFNLYIKQQYKFGIGEWKHHWKWEKQKLDKQKIVLMIHRNKRLVCRKWDVKAHHSNHRIFIIKNRLNISLKIRLAGALQQALRVNMVEASMLFNWFLSPSTMSCTLNQSAYNFTNCLVNSFL